MSVRTALGNRLRSALAASGYVLWKKQFLRPGLDPWLDVARLSAAWGIAIGTVFDVGANDGQARNELAEAFPGAVVHSFEPHPATFRRLECACQDGRGLLHNIALGPRSGDAVMYQYGEDGDGSQMNSLTPTAGFAVRHGFDCDVVAIRSETLDGFCRRESIDRIDLLKLDTEGFDFQVLQSGAEMLKAGRVTFVYVEFNDLFDRDGITGGSLVPMAEFLQSCGFRFLATYTDRIDTDGPVWVSSNALFVHSARAAGGACQ